MRLAHHRTVPSRGVLAQVRTRSQGVGALAFRGPQALRVVRARLHRDQQPLPPIQLGEERMARLMRRQRKEKLAPSIQRLLEDAREWTGLPRFDDDVTLLGIEMF